MHLSLILLLLFAAIVTSWINTNLHYDDEKMGDKYEYSSLLLENSKLMRSLASSVIKLPINTDEIRGLQYLYNATNGDTWKWNDDTNTYGIPWNVSVANLSLVHPCYDHWQGILCSCNSSYSINTNYYAYYDDLTFYYYDDVVSYPNSNYSCHITKIYLPGYNLTGVLPGEMFVLLPNLTHLSVDSNSLSSPLPTAMNQSSLLLLNIKHNNFEESLNVLGSITTLQVLIAFRNSFTGDLGPLQHLQNLNYIDLGANSLTGTLETGKLSNLQDLNIIWLNDNYLTGDLSEVSGMVGLKRLYLDSNQLTGSIESVSYLTNLQYLYLNYNQFSGSIEPVKNLLHLQRLYLFLNYFTGSIEAVSDLTKLNSLAVYSNQFTGSISSLSNLTSLQYLSLNLNQFTGSISSVSNLTNLIDLQMHSNKLTGSIHSVTNLKELQLIYLSNNMLSGSLEPLIGLNQLQGCILNHNLFTGSIPSLHNASELLIFIVEHNLLTGPLLPNGFPNSTEIIDVANNMLTGELPMALFSLPTLYIFSAGINCMTARFTDAVCNASVLTTLILDGLHSSSSCRTIIPVRVYDTMYFSYQSVLSLPSCIYSLPNISNLHLSGNGITDSLPFDVTLNDGFVELIISNNEYRSIIPDVFQNHHWDVFDVSYNKFSGTLLPSLAVSSSARLKLNRISGNIPSSLYNTSDVAVLTGNIFTCTNEELDKLDDEVQDRYVCGSSSFTSAGLLWFTLVILTITTIALSYMSQKSSVTKIIPSMVTLLHDIRTRFLLSSDLSRVSGVISNELRLSVGEIPLFHMLGQTVRFGSWIVTAVFVLVNLPLYCIFSTYFGTYSITYAWTASAAYLSGVAPGAILLLLYLVIIVVPCYYHRSYLQQVLLHENNSSSKGRSSIHPDTSNSENQSRSERNISMISVMSLTRALSRKSSVKDSISKETIEMVQKRFISMCIISAVNIVVVGTLHFAYVLVTLNYNSTVVTLVDIAMGVFEAVWTNVVIIEAIRLFDVHYIKSVSKAGGQRLSFLSFTSILNTIIIPCVALSLASPDCFYNLIYSRDDVSSSYSSVGKDYFYDAYLTPISFESQLRFTPSYAYSYQCSSAILTSYAVIFLYSALFGLISEPIRDWVNENVTTVQAKLVAQSAVFLSSKRNSSSSSNMASIVPFPSKIESFDEDDDDDDDDYQDPIPSQDLENAHLSSSSMVLNRLLPINPTLFILNLVTTIAVMLSFGCVFPFLAFILFLTIIGQTKYAEYRVGQYIESVVSCPSLTNDDKTQRLRELNDELRDMQQKVIRSLWQVVPCLGPFYGIFVFDIIGDATSLKHAIFAPVLLLVTGVVIYLIPYMQVNSDMTADSDNMVHPTIISPSKTAQVSPDDCESHADKEIIMNN